MIQWILAVWFLVPLPFPNPAWTSESSRFMYYWSLAWRILSIILLVCEMSAIVQLFEHSLALSFFEVGMKTDLFSYHLGYESIIFFTFGVLNWNWCQCNVGSFKILAVFPFLQLLEKFKKSWCYFFNCHLEFAIWSCVFCVGKFILINLFACHCSVQIFYLFLIWSY